MTTSIDQQFVEYVVKSLVSNPDAVKINRTIDEKGVLLELTVDPEDLGRVIGKRGATAQSIRTLLRALGTKQEARYNLKIVDVDRLDENGVPMPRPERAERRTDQRNEASEGRAMSDDSSTSSTALTTDSSDDTDDSFENIAKAKQNDAISRTRAELADLDDLDI